MGPPLLKASSLVCKIEPFGVTRSLQQCNISTHHKQSELVTILQPPLTEFFTFDCNVNCMHSEDLLVV